MGSGIFSGDEADITGRLLARSGVHMLTGGGGGQMLAVSRSFTGTESREGLCLGILPCRRDEPLESKSSEYPNDYVEIPIRTHLYESSEDPMSRNHINVLTSDLLIFLPGSGGTLSEARLAERYRKPKRLFVLESSYEEYRMHPILEAFSETEVVRSERELSTWLTVSLEKLRKKVR